MQLPTIPILAAVLMAVSPFVSAQEPIAPINPAGTPLTARPIRSSPSASPSVSPRMELGESQPLPTPVQPMPTPSVPIPTLTPLPTPVQPVPTPAVAVPTLTPLPTPIPTPVATPAMNAPVPPVEIPTPTPLPASSVPRPSARPSARATATPAEEMIPFIDFPNTPISSVLEYYEGLTGKKALYDSTVQGNIRVRVTKPIAKSEAIRIIETVLSLNNFTLIPGPGDIVRVINTAKNAKQFPIPIFCDIDDLPSNNQVVSFLYKLENADPTEVAGVLNQVITPTPSVTSIIPLPKSQAVLMTEYSDTIRNISPVLARLDSKPAEVVSVFLPLERADAKEVVEKLTKLFEKPSGQSGAAAPAPGTPPAAGGATRTGPVTLSEDSLILGKIRIDADLRTNRVHVVTRPENLPFLRRLIEDIDAGIPLGVPYTRPLRFVLAGDVLDILAGAVAEPGVKVEKIEGGRAGGTTANPVSNTAGNLGSTNPNSQNSLRSSGRTSSSISAGPFGSGNNTLQSDTAPEGRIIRNTKILADNRINAIIVIGSTEMRDKVFKLLDQIDVRAPQVMLTVVIGELRLTGTQQFGVDYLLNKGHLGNILASASNSILSGTGAGLLSNLPTGLSLRNIFTASSLPSLGGGVTGLIGAGNSLDILVSALDQTQRFRTISRPVIFTSNNRPAIISSGASLPVPSQIIQNVGVNGAQTNVDYIDVELKLSVLPLINSEGEVTLHISQENNGANGTTNIGGNNIPNVTTQSIDTTVSVANEATVVLGGLVKESKNVSKSGIPVLYKLPLIGPLFGFTDKGSERTELIVLIKPTVTKGPVEDVRTGERTMEKTNFPPDLDASLDPKGTRVNEAPAEKPFLAPKPLLHPDN